MKTKTLYGIAAVLGLFILLRVMAVAPHDWGDDFAMYIMQAASYAGDSTYSNLYIYNPNDAMYAPPSYPPGFSAMLTPVYLIAGADVSAFQTYMCLLLALTALAVYAYGRQQNLHMLFAGTLVILLCFHCFTLELKQQVLSDIPFTGLVFLFLYVQSKQKSWYVLAIIALLALITRTAAIALTAAWFAEIICILIFERTSTTRLLENLKGWAILLTATVIMAFLFPIFSGYAFSTRQPDVFATIHDNYYIYKQLFEDYFMQLFGIEEPVFKFLSWPLFFLFLTGVYVQFKNHQRTGIFFFITYLVMILAYPYKWGGYRMIFPLIPVMWLLILQGLQFFIKYLRNYSTVTTAAFGLTLCVCVVLQLATLRVIHTRQTNHIQSMTSMQLFSAIKNYVPEKAVVASARPRALALFTKRKSIFMQRDMITARKIKTFLKKYHVGYLVKMNPVPHGNIDIMAVDSTRSELLWNNADFSLYRIKD